MIHMEFFFLDISSFLIKPLIHDSYGVLFLDISSFLIKPLIHDLLIKSLIKELIRNKSFIEIKLST